MCDERDRNQELLEKLSRQLSELSSVNGTDIIDDSIGNPPWAPSEEEHSSTFSPLYTWNTAFLPASSSDSSHQFSIPDFHQPSTLSPSLAHTNHNLTRSSWSQNPEFQVVGDLSGRFSNTKLPVSSQPGCSLRNFQHFPQPETHFHSENSTPIVAHSFGPAQPKEELFSDLTSVLRIPSPSLNHHSHNSSLSLSTGNQPVSGGGIDGFHTSNNFCELPNPSPFFDPSTPPPPFPCQQVSDTPRQPTKESVSASSEFSDYLQRQSELCDLNLDSTFSCSEGWPTYSGENKDVSHGEDGKQLYADALSKWNSFDFAACRDSSSDISGDNKNSAQSVCKESETIGQDSNKPSYSDIAKTPKISPSVTPRVEQSNFESSTRSQFPTKDSKSYRSPVQRSYSASKIWLKGNVDEGLEQLNVSPTSRYGLDSFEDNMSGNVGKNSELLNNIARTKGIGNCDDDALDDLTFDMIGESVANNIEKNEDQGMDMPDQKILSGVNPTQSKMCAPVSSKKLSVTSGLRSGEKLFFDPKRIFQQKNNAKCRAQPLTPGKTSVNENPEEETVVLNNGKPTSSSCSSKLPTTARQHDYINNDLRDDSHKVTNKTAAESIQHNIRNEDFYNKQKEPTRFASGKRSGSGRVNGSYHREKRKTADNHADDYSHAPNAHRFLPFSLDMEKLEEWFCLAWEKMLLWTNVIWTSAFCCMIYGFGLILNLLSGAYHLTRFLMVKIWRLMVFKVYSRLGNTREDSSNWKSKESVRRRIGLEENIVLPATGEEAMKRLLAGKGKDPYSILGVRQDSSDEDIKKYYRKQAVLVHPDKNQEPGSEEAFKILGHAFEKIGEPGKRKEYDEEALVESASELRKEFADLISKLQSKIQEAANLMPCDNCGKKHRRVPVDRPFYSARFCQKCNIRHPAKEGDVWAESSMLGFYWNYYALMDGSVYDITEWMKCHHEFYRRMRANEHTVLTRIATDSAKKSKQHHSTRDPNLEEFFNRIFPKTPGGGMASRNDGAQNHSGAEPGWGQASHSNAGSSFAATATKKAGGGGGRRKKKKH